jgi:flagellar assembly protein FliH
MKSSRRRVIKSAEVDYFSVPGGMVSRLGGRQGDSAQPSGGTPASLSLERIKEMFEKKALVVGQESYQKGLSEGIRKGRDLQQHETLQSLQAMSRIVAEMSDLKKKILENAEQQVIELSLAIAEKVLHLEVTTNREVVRNVLKEAIKNIVDRENMKIRVHPKDFHYMLEIKSDFLQNFDGIKNIVFAEDESVQRGGAIIETLFGEVDARLDQQFQEIKTVMIASKQI